MDEHRRRAVITGLGAATPAGIGVGALWSKLLDGSSAAAPLREPDPAIPVVMACEVPPFDAAALIGAGDARRMDRFSQLAVIAAEEALADGGTPAPDTDRAAVVVGNTSGGALTTFEQHRRHIERGPKHVNPLYAPTAMANAPAGVIAVRAGWHGPNLGISTACASGAHAIGEALRLVRDGSADIVLAGGTEASITPIALNAFHRLGALSTRNDDPASASRPFDRDRDGFVMGEGAAFCLVEDLEHARSRGARIYAELVGYGRNTDAHHMVMPAPDGVYAARCMQAALADAGLAPDAIAHVHAHGTSTPLNDVAEARAISSVFGAGAPAVTSSKGAVGHLVSAAGALSTVASCLAVHHSQVPPTANLENLDPEIALDVVSGAPRPAAGPALVNAFAFGGHNASLVLASA